MPKKQKVINQLFSVLVVNINDGISIPLEIEYK